MRGSTRLIRVATAAFICAVVAMTVGCGYRDDLDKAETRIEQLNTRVARLTEELNELKKSEQALKDRLAAFKNRKEELSAKLELMEKEKSGLSKKNSELKKQVNDLESELKDVRAERDKLSEKVEELAKTVKAVDETAEQAPLPAPEKIPTSAALTPPAPVPAEKLTEKDEKAESESLSPCDRLMVYMKKGNQIIKRFKGEERENALAQLKDQYKEVLEKAPKEAVEAAESYSAQVVKWWDGTDRENTAEILMLRDKALKTCGKTIEDVGGF